MKTLYENDADSVEKGFMVISGNGTALSVFPYEDDWRPENGKEEW